MRVRAMRRILRAEDPGPESWFALPICAWALTTGKISAWFRRNCSQSSTPIAITSNAPGSAQIRRGGSKAWKLLLASLTFFVAGLVPTTLAAQDPAATFHVDVRLVSIFVNVTDKNGAFVGSLTKDDFAVFEDGRLQQVAVFEKQSELPLNLSLAIDTSASVRKDLSEEAAAARRFARDILRPQDQMSVVQFATTVSQLTPFTNKLRAIDHGLNQLHGDWATALYDAIRFGSERLGVKDGRKVLVLISDGDDTAQGSTYPQALESALRNEVMIYSLIDVPIEASAGRDLAGEHALITLSEQTGGKYFYVADGGLDKAFAMVSDDLRTQYLIGYYPRHQAPGTAFHRIKITIPRAAPGEFTVRTKIGYYANSAAEIN